MAEYGRYPSHSYSPAPSAPPMPDSYSADCPDSSSRPESYSVDKPDFFSAGRANPYSTGLQDSNSPGRPPTEGYAYPPLPPSYSYPYPAPWGGGGGASGSYFPPGTPPEVIRSFQEVDRDHSGSIDESELQAALSTAYNKFSIRTIRLLMFLFKNPRKPSNMGPVEFAAVWSCLGQWQAIFYRFDRDRSGKMDAVELKDALISLGYAVPPSVIQVLLSNYTDAYGRAALNFDNFVECGMIVKGLTEKFKEKDTRYTGSATFSYDEFLLMIIPFIVPWDA